MTTTEPATPATDEPAKPATDEPAKAAPLPDTPEAKLVAKARAAFDVGDFKLARVHAEGASRSGDPTVRSAADDILARTRLDPVQLALFGGCLALLLGITYWFVLR